MARAGGDARWHVVSRAGFQMTAAFLCLLVLCPVSGAAPLRIYTAIEPLAFCVQHIGGELLTVEALLHAGQDPHLFDPEPHLLRRLSKADVYLASGLPFEQILIKKIPGRQKKPLVIDLTPHIHFQDMDPDSGLRHEGGHNAGDTHAGRDPHFWLGALQLRQFILASAHAITSADPGHAAIYQKNTDYLLSRIDAMHARSRALLAPYRNRVFFVYHPAFGYFARTYGLQQHAVEIGGHQPGPRHVAALIRQARTDNVHTIFVQPQFDAKSATAIAEAINGIVLPLDPMAADVIQNIETMARAIADSFAKDRTPPSQ